jgi:hypothetical protein
MISIRMLVKEVLGGVEAVDLAYVEEVEVGEVTADFARATYIKVEIYDAEL